MPECQNCGARSVTTKSGEDFGMHTLIVECKHCGAHIGVIE